MAAKRRAKNPKETQVTNNGIELTPEVQEINDEPELSQEARTETDETEHSIPASDIEEMAMEVQPVSAGSLQSLHQKKEPRKKRIQSLITESAFNDLSRLAGVTRHSFNDLLNIILEEYINTNNVHNMSDEELRAAIYGEPNSN
jgi:hypothetical protein